MFYLKINFRASLKTRDWDQSGAFIVNVRQISYFVLMRQLVHLDTLISVGLFLKNVLTIKIYLQISITYSILLTHFKPMFHFFTLL